MRFKAFCLYFFIFLSSSFAGESFIPGEKKVYKSLTEAMHDSLLVEVLDLSRNGLKEFPIQIASFPNLKELYLSHNKIDEIPAEICRLSKLEVLDVSVNKLTTLPHQIGGLSLLRELLLFRNKISILPPSIGMLKSLTKLDLWNNQLEFLPPELLQLTGLNELDLRGIVISYEDQKKLSKKLSETQIYFSLPCNCSK